MSTNHRYFTHAAGFQDCTLYLRAELRNGEWDAFVVRRDGTEGLAAMRGIEWILENVAAGDWREIDRPLEETK